MKSPKSRETPVAPKAVDKAVAPKAVDKAVAPKAVDKAVAPKAVDKAVAPKAVDKAVAPKAVDKAVQVAADVAAMRSRMFREHRSSMAPLAIESDRVHFASSAGSVGAVVVPLMISQRPIDQR